MTLSPHKRRRPWAAAIVVAGSALLSALYFATWVWSAAYLPWWPANLALAVATAVVAAALDSLKPDLVQVAAADWATGRRWRSLGPASLALLLGLVSLWAIDGTLLKLRVDGSGGAAEAIAAHDRTARTLKDAEGELARLGPVRSVKEISAAMGLVRIELDVLRRTNHCAPAQITREDSRVACEPLMRLHQEMAQATRKEDLATIVRDSRARLDARPRPVSADPQLEMWAKVVGSSEVHVGLVIAGIVGLALELVALFGPGLLERRQLMGTGPLPPRPRLETPRPPMRPLGEQAALADLLQQLALGRRPYVAECAVRWQVNRGEASKRLADWERQGLVGSWRQGKLKLIGPA